MDRASRSSWLPQHGWRSFAVAALVACLLALSGCSGLPTLENRTVSTALRDTQSTRLGVAAGRMQQPHPGLTGVLPLVDAHDAFAARATLAEAAERSLDVQYYIWRDDLSGSLLLDALRRAADRGVRVRLLLDDNNTQGLDEKLRELDSHPLIEVRLFNPFVHRRWRALDFLGDFGRVNRRMRNKSFTADNQVTVIGGRNVGDEYFGAGTGPLFHVFIGSFNFDPRSARLNTELGFVIESPALATRVAEQFAGEIPARSYRVQLRDGELQWLQQGPNGPTVWTSEPHASPWLQLQVWLLSLLPIEGLL